MEEVKYIPGDLVMTNGVPLGTAKDVVYRVTSSDPSKTLELNDGTVLKGVVRLENIEGAEFGDKGYLFGDCCAWVKDIAPIPITPEILEKNGWKRVDDNPVDFEIEYFGTEFSNGVNLFYNVLTDIYRYDKHTIMIYLHELQHLFFGLGLKQEMEV